MIEHKSKIRAFGVSLLFGLASISLTACNNSGQENTSSGMMGRLTSVSDTKVVVEVFDRPSNAVSGGAADGGRALDENTDGKKPEGTPPADFKPGEKPEGAPPDGTPPAGQPEGKQEGEKEGGGNPQNGKKPGKGQNKTFTITDDTKIYKQDGEEKTEISAGELELGSMISVVAEGDTAEVVTVLSGMNRQKGQGIE